MESESPTLVSELAKKTAKLEYRRRWRRQDYERRQHLNRLLPQELPLFQADPLLEQKRGWADVIVCRVCGLKVKGIPNHVTHEHRNQLQVWGGLPTEATSEALMLLYRRRFGYGRGAPLWCKDSRQLASRNMKATNLRRRQGRKPSVGQKSRFRKGRTSDEARSKILEWGTSEQARQNMSASRQGRPLPAHRKRSPTGQTVADWRIAKLRLEGKTTLEIAKSTDPPLTQGAVSKRLVRMNFPHSRNPYQFFRGEPVTEKSLRTHFEELTFLRVLRPLTFRAAARDDGQHNSLLSLSEVSELLSVPPGWIREHTRQRSKDQIPKFKSGKKIFFDPEEVLKWTRRRRGGKSRFLGTFKIEEDLSHRLGLSASWLRMLAVSPVSRSLSRVRENPISNPRPLSWDLGGRLLSSVASLRDEYRRVGSTHRGGRPKLLLPNEEKELPGKYQALKTDLGLMLHWAERQDMAITLDVLGEWMCEQSSRKRLNLLLFWPDVHTALTSMCEQARIRARVRIDAAERAKDLLSQQYRLSRRQLAHVITQASPLRATPNKANRTANGKGAVAPDTAGHDSARDEASEWLQTFLATGPRMAKELERAARTAGLSWVTVRRAKKSAGVESCKQAFGGGWLWQLKRRCSFEDRS